MVPVAAALIGVLVGAAAAAGTALLLLRRAADRDLVERRMRALVAYRDILGPPPADGALPDPAELEQLLHDAGACAREFRLTAWIFDDPTRRQLARPLGIIEEEIRRSRARGEAPGPVAVLAALREMDGVLRKTAGRCLDEHRRWRLWPLGGDHRSEGAPEDVPPMPLVEAGAGEDGPAR
jgi:hypothetical protein